jgi:hypothetical protein
MEYLLRFISNIERFVSDPPGLEMWFWPEIMAFVTNDGRVIAFDAALNGFVVYPSGTLIRFVAKRNRYESEDGTIIIWFDAVRMAWVINEGGTPRYTVTANITGEGAVSGTGFYETGTSVTVSATPAQGWELSVFTIGGATIGNPHTFTMPSSNVVVFAEFIQTENYLLTEAGDFLLLESGDKIII